MHKNSLTDQHHTHLRGIITPPTATPTPLLAPLMLFTAILLVLVLLLFVPVTGFAFGDDPDKRGTRGNNKGYQVTYLSVAPYVTSIQKGDVLGLGLKFTFTPVSTKYGRLFVGSRLDRTPYDDYGQHSLTDETPFNLNLVNTGASIDFGYITASKFLNIWFGAGPSFHNLEMKSIVVDGTTCNVGTSGYYEGFNKFMGLELFASEHSPFSFFYEYRHDNVIQQQSYALTGDGCGTQTLLLDRLLGTTIKYHTFGIGYEFR